MLLIQSMIISIVLQHTWVIWISILNILPCINISPEPLQALNINMFLGLVSSSLICFSTEPSFTPFLWPLIDLECAKWKTSPQSWRLEVKRVQIRAYCKDTIRKKCESLTPALPGGFKPAVPRHVWNTAIEILLLFKDDFSFSCVPYFTFHRHFSFSIF